jgi:hypothetical protein
MSIKLTDRKKPIRHLVKGYVRNHKPVRSYSRGNGLKEPKQTPSFMSKPKKKDRWEQISSGPDYQWKSNENPKIMVNVNLEQLEEQDENDEWVEVDTYLVYPAYDHRGIPNSPETFSEGSSGSFSEAKKDAIKLAEKIMKLPIEKIERFDWDMV